MSEPPNFSAKNILVQLLTTVQNCLEKRKNFYLIKFVSKWKNLIKKAHTSNLVAIDSALNSASKVQIHFFTNADVVSRNTAKLEKKLKFKIFLRCLFWPTAAKLESVKTKTFLQEVDQESCE